MSHISVVKTKIKSFNLSFLKASLNNSEVEVLNCNEARDTYVVIKADLLIRDKKTGRIFGINFKTGEFVVDTYGWSERFNQIKNAIVQKYIATVIAQKLQKAGYKVNLSVREGIIVGEGWK